MKKILAMLLAASTVVSVGVTALADDVNSNINEINTSVVFEDAQEDSSAPESSAPESSAPESSAPEASTPEASASESSTPESTPDTTPVDPADAETILSFNFGADVDSGFVLGTDILEPKTEYKFPVMVATKAGGDAAQMTDTLMDLYKYSYNKSNTSGISKFEIDDSRGKAYLYVTTRDTVSSKLTDAKVIVKMTKKDDKTITPENTVKFQYGFDEGDHDYINDLDEGDTVEIDNARPVITASMFNKIAKINNYKNVTLSGNDESWLFTVNVTDESTKNMVSNNAGVKAILAEFGNQDFKFFNFPGAPSFSATGKLELDVEDIVDDFAEMYTYRYSDGKLYKLNASFDSEENLLNFRTNKLDTFVVTDKQIKDGYVVSEGDSDKDTSDKDEDNTDTDADKNNPGTGAGIDLAVMAAIASLAGAGALAVKKAGK